MSYRVVQDYYRQRLFDLFSPYESPFWAVTFEVEITALRTLLREREYPTYLNLCYFFTRAARPIEDFRYRLAGGELRLYEELHPALTVPAAGGRFHFVYYDFDADLERFNRAAAADQATDDGELLAAPPDRAWLFFSSLPGVPFTGLTHATVDRDDSEPRVSFGRFRIDGARTFVPVGLQVNHRLIDGRPVAELVERLEGELAAPG